MCGNKASFNAKVTSSPKDKQHHTFRHKEKYDHLFGLDNVKLYLDKEIVIDVGLRFQSEAFAGKDPVKNLGWFIQSTHKITKKDLLSLTGQK